MHISYIEWHGLCCLKLLQVTISNIADDIAVDEIKFISLKWPDRESMREREMRRR